MTDRTILRLVKETTELLGKIIPGYDVESVVPSYNAVLAAAQENHPKDKFINALAPIESVDSAVELSILFTQLRIALEAEQENGPLGPGHVE